jgi:hypothetical protein
VKLTLKEQTKQFHHQGTNTVIKHGGNIREAKFKDATNTFALIYFQLFQMYPNNFASF